MPAGTAFASDFDGTLCQSDWVARTEHFDPADLDAVRRYQEAGGLFGICTGRPSFEVAESLRGKLELDFYIAVTGAQILDRNMEPIFERTIPREVAEELYALRPKNAGMFLAVSRDQFVEVGESVDPMWPRVGSLAELRSEPFSVSLEFLDDEDAARIACARIAADYGDVVAPFQNKGSVDIVPAGCSKGVGVRIAREALGVTCMAGIGDSYNDLPLLEAADVSYTFHASPEPVREAAGHLVDSVAQALGHFLSL